MVYKNKEKRNKTTAKYRKNHREKIKIIYNRHYQKLRENVIDVYGATCMICGFKDKRALQIDHINGGGSKQRKIMSPRQLLFYLKRNNFPKENYQILCANCNSIKKMKKKEFRYK